MKTIQLLKTSDLQIKRLGEGVTQVHQFSVEVSGGADSSPLIIFSSHPLSSQCEPEDFKNQKSTFSFIQINRILLFSINIGGGQNNKTNKQKREKENIV